MQAAGQQVGDVAVVSLRSPVHGDVSFPVAGTLSIGRGLSSDIVLSDPSLSADHLRLEARGGEFLVTAIGGTVLLAGGTMLRPGEAKSLDSSGDIHVGDLLLRIELPQRAAAKLPQRKRRHLLWPAAAVGVVAVLACVLGPTAYSAADTPAANLLSASHPQTTLTVAEQSVSEVRYAILAELHARKLSTIVVETLPEGSNRAEGIIEQADAEAWQDVKRWADERFGSVMLIDNVVAAARGPSLAIQSAWVGETPYVIDGSGEKLFVGAMLPDSWTVEGIEAGRVRLDRRGQKLVVRF